MPYLLARVMVKDPANWRREFKQQESIRRENGMVASRVFGNLDNPNELVVLLEWNDLEQARHFARSHDPRKGVVDQPTEYIFLDDITVS